MTHELTLEEMLSRMASVIWMGGERSGQWAARLKNSDTFSRGINPEEAMRRALGQIPQTQAARRRQASF